MKCLYDYEFVFGIGCILFLIAVFLAFQYKPGFMILYVLFLFFFLVHLGINYYLVFYRPTKDPILKQDFSRQIVFNYLFLFSFLVVFFIFKDFILTVIFLLVLIYTNIILLRFVATRENLPSLEPYLVFIMAKILFLTGFVFYILFSYKIFSIS